MEELKTVSAAEVRAFLAARRGEAGLSPRSLSQNLSAVRAFHTWLDRRLGPRERRGGPGARAEDQAHRSAPRFRGPGAWFAARSGHGRRAGAVGGGAGCGGPDPALRLRPAHLRGPVPDPRRCAPGRDPAHHRQGRQDADRAGAPRRAGGGGRLPAPGAVRPCPPHLPLFRARRGGALSPRHMQATMAKLRGALGLPDRATPSCAAPFVRHPIFWAPGRICARSRSCWATPPLSTTQKYTAVDAAALLATYAKAHPRA